MLKVKLCTVAFCLFILIFPCIFLGTAYTAGNSGETVEFIPTETTAVLNNPYMGWAPRAKGGDYRLPHRMVYMDVTWDELEPQQGEFRFDGIEEQNKLDYWAKQNIKVILRLVLDKPKAYSQRDIPRWLYKKIKGDGTWYKNDYGKGFSPNYSNPALISYHQKLIEKLAERYNRDPRIAFIQLGSIGHWGEWHTHTNDKGNPFPRNKVADEYVRHYLDNFTEKYLLIRRPMPVAADRKLGLYNDMFGNKADTKDGFIKWFNNGYVFWLTGESMPKMPDFWKYAPSGGEFAPSESMRYLYDEKFQETLDQARLTHLSWLGPNCPASRRKLRDDVQKNADELLKTIGYRFVVKKEEHPRCVKTGEALKISLQWLNKGVAPFYFDWKVEMALADNDGKIVVSNITKESIRNLLPGITEQHPVLPIPVNFTPGKYTLCIAVIDPETNKPGVKLAIDGEREDGRYTLGKVTVIP